MPASSPSMYFRINRSKKTISANTTIVDMILGFMVCGDSNIATPQITVDPERKKFLLLPSKENETVISAIPMMTTKYLWSFAHI